MKIKLIVLYNFNQIKLNTRLIIYHTIHKFKINKKKYKKKINMNFVINHNIKLIFKIGIKKKMNNLII